MNKQPKLTMPERLIQAKTAFENLFHLGFLNILINGQAVTIYVHHQEKQRLEKEMQEYSPTGDGIYHIAGYQVTFEDVNILFAKKSEAITKSDDDSMADLLWLIKGFLMANPESDTLCQYHAEAIKKYRAFHADKLK